MKTVENKASQIISFLWFWIQRDEIEVKITMRGFEFESTFIFTALDISKISRYLCFGFKICEMRNVPKLCKETISTTSKDLDELILSDYF